MAKDDNKLKDIAEKIINDGSLTSPKDETATESASATKATAPVEDNKEEQQAEYDQMKEQIKQAEEQGRESMKEVLTNLQSVTADKAVLTDAFNALESISFKDLIGKPIQAAIQAQADAAKSTLDFVRELCPQSEDGTQKVAMVSFEFFRNGKKAKMNIPLLSLVNIPSLEITQMTYKFTAKIDAHSSLIVSHNTAPTITGGKSSNKGTSTNPSAPASPSAPAATASTGTTASTATTATPAASKGAAAPAATSSSAPAEGAAAAKNASAAENTVKANAKANVTKDTTFAASYTAQTGTSATKDSKYAVETTMDISITVAPDEIPSGIKTMLSILDGSVEIVNPNGELYVGATNVVMENGYGITTANYTDPDGVCAPSSIKCNASEGLPEPKVMLSTDCAKILFTKPGLYFVTAGKLTEPVFVVDNSAKAPKDEEQS